MTRSRVADPCRHARPQPGTPAIHRLGQLINLGAGAAKDNGGRRSLHVERAAQGSCFARPANDVRGLADQGLASRRLVEPNLIRSDLQIVLGTDSIRRHRAGTSRSAARSRLLEDGLDVLGETHVEHLVGLVKHNGADVVERGEPRRTGRSPGPESPRRRTPAKSRSWRWIGYCCRSERP